MHAVYPLAATLSPGVLRLGGTRVSVFGLLAAVGLLAALALSQLTARPAGITPQQAWDAGIFAVFAAFVGSRLLLVAEDPRGFLRFPLLVLSLPSLTATGLALTALASLLYLRWKRLPLLPMLDAFAAPAALLAAVLSLAHAVEGTAPGMPIAWLHGRPAEPYAWPVQRLAMAAALLLLLLLLQQLRRAHPPGRVAALALTLGGLVAWLLDLLTQPADVHGRTLLEPAQIAALASFACGALLLVWAKPRSSAPSPALLTPRERA